MSKDLFSNQAENYALYRPVYPEELFTYILSFVTNKDVAWDCATGNGQSALPLSQYFKKVFASDISKKQLEQAPKKENIEYMVCSAEKTPFPDNSFDLITVSQAYHWLDWEKFHREATRVAKENCVIGIWMYDLLFSREEKLTELIIHFYKNITGPYWDKERKHIDDHYLNVWFEFDLCRQKNFLLKEFLPKRNCLVIFLHGQPHKTLSKQMASHPLSKLRRRLAIYGNQVKANSFDFLFT